MSAVVYIDAGYLIAAAATRLTGTSLRSGVKVDYPELIGGLIEAVEADGDATVLRVCWYDGARKGQPTEEQRTIGLLPRTKIRIGRISYAGEQKGVDLRLGLDMVSNAQRRVADVAYLVSGDDDLTEAVEVAQGYGTQVVLMGVPELNRLGVAATAENLALTVDRILPLSGELLERTMIRRLAPPVAAPSLSVDPSVQSTDAAPSLVEGAQASAARRPSVVPPPTSRRRPAVPPPASVPVYTTTTGVESDGCVLYDPVVLGEIAGKLVSAWVQSGEASAIEAAASNRPQIPPELDRVLLYDVVATTGVHDLPFETKVIVRKAFWDAFDRMRLG